MYLHPLRELQWKVNLKSHILAFLSFGIFKNIFWESYEMRLTVWELRGERRYACFL